MKCRPLLLSLLLMLTLLACGVKHQTSSYPPPDGDQLITQFAQYRLPSGGFHLSGNISVDLEDTAFDSRVDLYIRPGEGMMLSFRPIPFVEVARAYLLADQVIIVNKTQGTYASASYYELSQKFNNIPLSYDLSEALLAGCAHKDWTYTPTQTVSNAPITVNNAGLMMELSLSGRGRPDWLRFYPEVLGDSFRIEIRYPQGFHAQSESGLPKALEGNITKSGHSLGSVDLKLNTGRPMPDISNMLIPQLSNLEFVPLRQIL